MNNQRCSSPLPYPPLEVEGKNLIYAQLLRENYTGQYGEFSALTQYFYQYFLVSGQHAEFAEDLECISRVEMGHMEKIGKLITLLGGDPQYYTTNIKDIHFWNANVVYPTKDIPTFLRQNIYIEQRAIADYRSRIAQIGDQKVTAVLERIITDEFLHIELFKKYLGEFTMKD